MSSGGQNDFFFSATAAACPREPDAELPYLCSLAAPTLWTDGDIVFFLINLSFLLLLFISFLFSYSRESEIGSRVSFLFCLLIFFLFVCFTYCSHTLTKIFFLLLSVVNQLSRYCIFPFFSSFPVDYKVRKSIVITQLLCFFW